ncbi:MAG TPA: hypothetical protein VK188_08685 [Holophaga sp.]|nr:hypothetical protein [Holophaga sp.]
MSLRSRMSAAALGALAALPAVAGEGWFNGRLVPDIHGSLLAATPALQKVTEAEGGAALGASLAWRLAPDQDYHVRVSLSFLTMPGKDQHHTSPTGVYLQDRGPDGSFLQLKAGTTSTWELRTTDPALVTGSRSSLSDVQVALDLLFPAFTPRMKAFVGLTANRYRVSNSGRESYYFATDYASSYTYPFNGRIMPLNVFAVKNDKGIKGGVRAGVEYAFDAHWSAEAILQVTELGPGIAVTTDLLPNGKANSKKNPFNEVNRGPVNPSWLQFGARYRF